MTGRQTPSRARGVPRLPLSMVFLNAALFTVAWDLLGNVYVGTFNLKIPTILFTVALAARLIEPTVKSRRSKSPVAFGILLATLVVYGVAALLAHDTRAGVLQFFAIVVGAVIPFFAASMGIRDKRQLESALVWFVRGGYLVAWFGLYQLFADRAGLPTPIHYTAMAGGQSRIASVLYESGFFGYYMVVVIGGVFGLAALRATTVNMGTLLGLLAVVLLANTRASYATLPVLFFLLLWRRPMRLVRWVPTVTLIVFAAITLVLVKPSIYEFISSQFLTIFDPTEQSSNAPRLAGYQLAWKAIQGSPMLGIGPGNFLYFQNAIGIDANGTSNSIIANNAYLQALLDGGFVLLAFEVALMVALVRRTYRRSVPVARALSAGWLTVALVAFLGTSFYWDIKLWAVMGLAFAAVRVLGPKYEWTGSTAQSLTASRRQPGQSGGRIDGEPTAGGFSSRSRRT